MGNFNFLCVLLIIFLLEVHGAIDLCPPPNLKDCSGHGSCLSSFCTCDNGWGNAICNETGGDPNCDLLTVECPANSSRCVNNVKDPTLPPSWGCECYKGYSDQSSGSGKICADNDECILSTACPTTATCTNIPGSYFCTCKDGYQGDGTSCQDVNECESTPNPCATKANSQCVNLLPPSKYDCPCKEGYFEVRGENRCTNETRVPITPITPIDSGPSVGYVVIFKVIPSVVCWTRNPTFWKVYLSYNNRYYQERYIGENAENALVFNGASPQISYPGKKLSYAKGEHYAFVVENPKSSNTSSITWQLDGNRVTIESTDPEFNNHRCPKDIILSYSGDVSCTITKAQLQTRIRDGIISLLTPQLTRLNVPSEHNLTVDVTTGCTKKRSIQESATVTITFSDPATPTDTSKYSVMDIIFPTLINSNSSIANEIRKAGVNLTQDSPSLSSPSGINPISGSPDSSQVKAPPEPDLPVLNISFLTFAIIFGSVIIGLILLVIIAILVYKGRTEDEEERV